MDKIQNKYEIGIVGNCAFMAYIEKNSNVCWMCMPKFDSSFLFGSLIDKHKGGEFIIIPKNGISSSKQYYIQNTNILCSEFTSKDGSFRITDFAPRFLQNDRYFKPLMLFRKLEPIDGRPSLVVSCKPRGNYGETTPEVLMGSNHLRFMNLGNNVRLTTDISINNIRDEHAFVLSEARYMVFSYELPLEDGLKSTYESFFVKTRDYWQNWIKTTSIPSVYQKEMIRSALILKLHQYEDTGGIIASGSMSLPESDNSGRNWDYRYCWIRDTFYTLQAFNNIGHFEESLKYFQFIENVIASETNKIQPLYSVTGEKTLVETELDLEGFLGHNTPVRKGNHAYTHIQNDVYGQVLVSLLPLYTDLRLNYKTNQRSIDIIHFLLDKIEETIDQEDAGLWEFRNRSQKHCYTFLFHWAGSKAAMKIGALLEDKKLKERAFYLSEKAAGQIEKCYDPDKKAYGQAIGINHMDASTLKLITMGYLDPNSEKARLHIKAIEIELKSKEGFIHRYKHPDDFGEPENVFMICSFWYAECLALAGRQDECKQMLDKLINTGNHLGLFSEDVGRNESQWGNFPQTYSHVGLMNTVFRLDRKNDFPVFI